MTQRDNDDERGIYPLKSDTGTNTGTNTNTDRLSSLSSLSTDDQVRAHRLWATYPDSTHRILKMICSQQGLSLDQVISNLIMDYVQKEAKELFKTHIHIENVMVEPHISVGQLIITDQLTTICHAIQEGIRRAAPKPYLLGLKDSLYDLLKKTDVIPKSLEAEVRAALTLLHTPEGSR